MKLYTSTWGMEYLEKNYDLSTPFESGLCGPGQLGDGTIRDDQCCKCLRRKKCQDLECKDKFNGRGKNLINIMNKKCYYQGPSYI